jgi:hypothetical protein
MTPDDQAPEGSPEPGSATPPPERETPGPISNRGRNLAALAIGAVALFTIIYRLVAGGDDETKSAPAPKVSIASQKLPKAEPPEPFYPETYREGRKTVVPLTFPDGTRVELVERSYIDFGRTGVAPLAYGIVRRQSHSGRQLVIRYRAHEVFERIPEPLRTYLGADGGTVEYWPYFGTGPDEGSYWLVFQFGDWTVAALNYPELLMNDKKVRAWAENLSGAQDERGFLILKANPPLRMLSKSVGSKLVFTNEKSHQMDLTLENCSFRRFSKQETTRTWCDRDTGVQIHTARGFWAAARPSKLDIRLPRGGSG